MRYSEKFLNLDSGRQKKSSDFEKGGKGKYMGI